MDKQVVIDTTKDLVDEYLTQLGLDADVAVEVPEKEAEDRPQYVQIHLEGENLNELVGYHGKNLEASQIILGLMLNNKIDDQRYRVIMEINDYKKSRESYLRSYAIRASEEVQSSGQEMELNPMKPYERRIVHMVLKKEEGIETESRGEGDDRRIVIKKIDELF